MRPSTRGLFFAGGLSLLSLVACSSNSDDSTSGALSDGGESDAASSTGGRIGSGGAGGRGGVSNGGATSSTGGATRPGNGGSGSTCPPECFVANECVTACGQEPQNHGCCPCPAGTVNVFSCSQGGGNQGGSVCDPRLVVCRMAPPACPDGQVPSVDGSCFGPCVPVDSCACDGPEACPDPNRYTCHLSAGHCGPYVQ